MNKNTLGWIALNCIPGIGPVLSHRLVADFASPSAVFAQPEQLLAAQKNIGDELARRIRHADWKQLAEQEVEKCRRIRCQIITLADKNYPSQLRNIAFPPPVLYVRGTLLPGDNEALAVVGSRRPSLYGVSATRSFVKELVLEGWTIISGLARGIDTLAHQTAIKNNGRTLAVLGQGLDQIYPPENKKLHDQIIEQGAVISEFPIGVPPRPNHFPRRNRIISGLAQGVLVIEARQTSGALITARWACEQGREVFAVPGSYHSRLSQGTHALIQDGAKLVTCLSDIRDEIPEKAKRKRELESQSRTAETVLKLSAEQKTIRQALAAGPLHIDQLAAACQQTVQWVMINLLTLELQGMVQSAPGQIYQWVGE